MPAWRGSKRRHVSPVSAGGRKTSARPNDVEARIPSICTWSVHQAVASRIFFVGGAGDDQAGWNYTERFKRIFTEEGITGFTRLHASHDDLARVKAGALPIADAIFMATKREKPLRRKDSSPPDPVVEKADSDILSSLRENPLEPGAQLNLAGYSYGSVLLAHVALRLSEQGVTMQNLILIGSPIPSSSELYSMLARDKNIEKLIRYDIPGDLMSNPSSTAQFVLAGIQNFDPWRIGRGPHFDLARPDVPFTPYADEGRRTDEAIRNLARYMKNRGVE
jgi:Thioesterase domain